MAKLKRLREKKNLTQAELAKEVGVSQISVNYWECLRTCPSAKNIRKLREFFGVESITRLDFKRIEV